jgi:hypothetical protein
VRPFGKIFQTEEKEPNYMDFTEPGLETQESRPESYPATCSEIRNVVKFRSLLLVREVFGVLD